MKHSHLLKNLTIIIFFLLTLVFLNTNSAFANQPRTIAIITSKIIGPYSQALKGFKHEIQSSGYSVKYVTYDIQKDYSQTIVNNLIDNPPDVIFTIGTEASLFAKRNFTTIPIVFTMVLDPVESGIVGSFSPTRSNIAGVSLKINVQEQFGRLQQIFPNIRRLGMLYDAQKKESLMVEAQMAAENLGIQLVAKPIYSKSQISKALDEVLSQVDVMWAGVDTLIYNPQSAKVILLATLRKKVPFMAFSSHYVKAGALLALECDYTDIGRQTGEMVVRVFKGYSPGSLPIEWPRSTKLITNQNTARVIGVKVPKGEPF